MVEKAVHRYREIFSFLRSDMKRPLIAAALCFGLGILLGAVIGAFNPQIVEDAMSAFEEQVRSAGIIGPDGSLSAAALLSNNWRAMLIACLCGVVPFLYLPAVSLLTNGVLLGLLASSYVLAGPGLAAYLAGILPHGIFEISALLVAAGCGVALCRYMRLLVTSNPHRPPASDLAADLLWVLLLVVAPLTVVAAGVEAYVTPLILQLFL